jgi:hypothetical protein
MMRVRHLLRAAVVLSVIAAVAAFLAGPIAARQTPGPPVAPGDPHVLAHYYIWFDPTSWNRAKVDFPLLGRYSSDEATVMRRHIELAQSAGIEGFIVSWKSSEVLDPRLEQLIGIAEELGFKLSITYQGLDFNREPLPIARIESDLEVFVDRFAASPVFDMFGKPLVVITGTWEMTQGEIQRITTAWDEDLFILASEKNVDDYELVADYVDGNLYYWSSVNPETNPTYGVKLVEMGAAVRSHGGIWIAPAAPGFDAREVGGTTVIERRDGATLREEWQVALDSLPDAIGVISWNEFSENTHVEPSLEYGGASLEVLAGLTGAPQPIVVDFDSSAPEGSPDAGPIRFIAIGGFAVVLVASTLLFVRRRGGLRSDGRDRVETPDGAADGSQPSEML